jgi:hypothetical protein
MILKTKIIALAVALTVTAPLAAWAAVGFPGAPLSTAVCSPVGPSHVVNTQMVGDREISVTWDPRSLLNCGVTGYNVVVIDSQGKPQQVVATVQRDAAGVYVRGLNLCTFYRFGVQAKYPGHVSEVSFPAKPAFVSGPPDKSPPVITVIVTGTSTSGPPDSFSPSTASFCTSPDGVMPSQNELPSLRNLADSWLNDTGGKTDKSSRTSGAGNNLIDSMAATGGYVLPYSYTGINMTGTAANPWLTVGVFTDKNVADANPLGACSDPTCHGLGEPPLLQASLASIHKTFPHTPIIVIGHSLGGLIAEQWWLHYSSNNTEGVIQVISLDSPLNGVAAGGVCATGLCGPSGNPLYNFVGYDSGVVYAGLWAHQGDPAGSGPYANNQTALALDSSNHLFTAIGDLGDPLYDVGDYSGRLFRAGVKNIGLMSQVFWTEPSCVQSGYDLSSAACTATGQAIINPCGHPMNDGTRPLFDVPGSMWIHSNVKNCPQVIDDALGWYHHYASAHPAPSPSPSPVSTSACSSQTFLSVVRSKGYAQSVTPSGMPACAGGYALETFVPYAGGQEAQFFFKKNPDGTWTIIEGGDAIPTIACRVIPASVLTKLRAQCPPAAYAQPSPPTPPSSISPGHATPKEAVEGFLHARFEGNETLACSYASPASRASCSSQISQQPAINGNIALHDAVVSGKFAVVEVTGRLCYPGLGCESNTNPLLGMPASPASFHQVYDDLVKSTTYTFSPYPCISVGGMWYINFGP